MFHAGMERFPSHIRDMAIPCPKCTVRAAIGIEGEFVFFGGQCIELVGTPYVNRFEWCPTLSEAIAREVRHSPSARHRAGAPSPTTIAPFSLRTQHVHGTQAAYCTGPSRLGGSSPISIS
jgi:hypothetical protein